MFNSPWWVDLRYNHERRMFFTSGIIVLVAAIGVGVLSYATYVRNQEEDELKLSTRFIGNSKTPVVAPRVNLLDSASKFVVDGKLDEATKVLREAELLTNRLAGMIAWKRGDMATALARFTEAVRISPDSSADIVNLAGVELANGKSAEAMVLMERARKLSPDDLYVQNRYLLARFQTGDVAGVRKEVQTALELSPENSLPRVAFGAAAIELAAGQFANGANFLYAAKGKLPSETFDSLLAEPLISAYSDRQELAPFFPRPLPGETPAAEATASARD